MVRTGISPTFLELVVYWEKQRITCLFGLSNYKLRNKLEGIGIKLDGTPQSVSLGGKGPKIQTVRC